MFKALCFSYFFLLMLGAAVLIFSSRLTAMQLPRREPGLLFKPIHKLAPEAQLSIIPFFEQQESAGLMVAELFASVWGEAQEKGWMSCVSISSQINLPPKILDHPIAPLRCCPEVLWSLQCHRRVVLSLSTSFISHQSTVVPPRPLQEMQTLIPWREKLLTRSQKTPSRLVR